MDNTIPKRKKKKSPTKKIFAIYFKIFHQRKKKKGRKGGWKDRC